MKIKRPKKKNTRPETVENDVSQVLIYKDEEDRAYGLAGMVIAVASMNAIDRVAMVELDSDGPMVTFGNEFYFPGSQSANPKAIWHRLFDNFQITSAMAISNVLSRRLIHEHTSEVDDMLSPLREVIRQEAEDVCSLEEDEADMIFNRMLSHSSRIFGNRRLSPLIDEFAGIIARRRRLSGRELAEELMLLQML